MTLLNKYQPNDLVFRHSGDDKISNTLSAVSTKLPPELRNEFDAIVCEYIAAYDIDGTIARLNGKSVSQIFSEYRQGSAKLVTSDELDGIRYKLYESNSAVESDNHERD